MDDGTLSVAKLSDDGKVEWLDLVHGQGPLTEANGFRSQADVVILARQAATLLGATPMDRPEDVEANKATGRVYAMLTNNVRRTANQVNAANPRPRNVHGHVVEFIPPGAGTAEVDHAAREMRWALFLMAGKPGIDPGAQYHRATEHGWLSCPDNCAFDSKGRIWIATDGAPTAAGVADGLYAADTRGPGRALTRLFYQAPTGAEICGPLFTPDERHGVPRHPASGRGWRVVLRPALDALARLRRWRAAAPVGHRHRQEGWRRHRGLTQGAGWFDGWPSGLSMQLDAGRQPPTCLAFARPSGGPQSRPRHASNTRAAGMGAAAAPGPPEGRATALAARADPDQVG